MLIDSPSVVGRPGLGTRRSSPAADRPLPLADVAEPPAAALSEAVEAYGLGPAALDAAIQTLPVGVLLVDGEGRVVWTNDAARRLRVTGLAAVRGAASRALLDERAVHQELSQRSEEDRTQRWVEIDATPVLDRAGGGVPLALLTVADVTARVRATQWAPIMESLTNL